MTRIYYLANSWKEIEGEIIVPINHTFGIDGGVDTVQVSFFTYQTFDIPLDTPIKLYNGTETRYYIVGDRGYSDINDQRLFTLTLIEPFEITRGYKLQACNLAERAYTLEYMVKRVLKLAKFDCEYEIPFTRFVDLRLTFASTTLYLALYEIARTRDSVPYFDFNDNTNKWVLKFQRLDGLNGRVYNEDILNPISQLQEIGEGIGKKVYFEGNNVKVGYNQNLTLIPKATDNTSSVGINNFGLVLGNNLIELSSIRIVPFEYAGVTNVNNQAWTIRNNKQITYKVYTGIYEELTKTFYIVPKKEYDLLSTTDKENRDNIYIYWENNIIYLNELSKLMPSSLASWNSDVNLIFIGYINSAEDSEVEAIHIGSNPLWTRTFVINAELVSSSILPMFVYNQSKYDDTVYYNQNATIIEASNSVKVLQTYIDNMSSGISNRTGTFKLWDEIPKEASLIKIGGVNYLVNSLTIVEHRNYYDVTFTLSQYHAKRREYMEADTDIRTYAIPTEDILETIYLDTVNINVSITEPLTPDRTFTKFKNNRDRYFILPSKEFYKLKIYSSFDDSDFFEDQPLLVRAENNIFFNVKAKSNIIWKEVVDNSGNMIPLSYGDGLVRNAKFELQDDEYTVYYENKYDGGTEVLPFKDKYEAINMTIQISYNGVNNTIVRDGYAKAILSGDERLPTIKLYDENIGRYEEIPTETLVIESTRMDYSVSTVVQKIKITIPDTNANYKAFGIFIGNNPILIKNYDTEQSSISSIEIYYRIEDGYPVQTGVRPYI